MPRKILIIDDDEPVRSALRSRFEGEGFEVITAENGCQGLGAAKQENPNLIILDLAMPDIDGLAVLDDLRNDIITWDIPVVVLSARADPESQERSRQLGVRRFFQKPLSPRILARAIKDLLNGIATQ